MTLNRQKAPSITLPPTRTANTHLPQRLLALVPANPRHGRRPPTPELARRALWKAPPDARLGQQSLSKALNDAQLALARLR